MRTQLLNLGPAGHGHYKITILFRNGKAYSAITNDMELIDLAKSETFTVRAGVEKRRAVRRLIDIVKLNHNLK